MFARADPFGMQFGEFLMVLFEFEQSSAYVFHIGLHVQLMYSLSERATTEDKTWVAFKVCDFSNRLALGVPELKQLLVSVLELRQQSLSESDMEAIIKYTIAVGDHNHSGALEYLEFREMIFSQPDFLNLFTVQLAMLCPALDVVRALGPSPPTTKGVLNMSNVKPVEADHAAEASARKERPAYVDQVYARVRQQSIESSPALVLIPMPNLHLSIALVHHFFLFNSQLEVIAYYRWMSVRCRRDPRRLL
jgi:Ca2+-binding EF-hand superfamily protein